MSTTEQRRARLFQLPAGESSSISGAVPLEAEVPEPGALTERRPPAKPVKGEATVKLAKREPSNICDEVFPVVRVVAGPDMFAYVVLDDDSLVHVGRDETADLVLRDGSVSRLHATFQPEGEERCLVSDLDSTNGVSVGGRQAKQHVLFPGDRVEVGSVAQRFEVLGLSEYKHLRWATARSSWRPTAIRSPICTCVATSRTACPS